MTLWRLRFSDKCVSDIALVMVCNDNVNKFHYTHPFTQREALLRLRLSVWSIMQKLTNLESRYPVPGTRYPVPATRYLLPATRYPVPATRYPPPGTRHPLPGTRYPVPVPAFSTMPIQSVNTIQLLPQVNHNHRFLYFLWTYYVLNAYLSTHVLKIARHCPFKLSEMLHA